MSPTYYDMALECLETAERIAVKPTARIEAMAAQTYATLALVDAVNAKAEGTDDNTYHIARTPSAAFRDRYEGGGYPTHGAAMKELESIHQHKTNGHEFAVYRVHVEVSQP